MRPNLTNCLRVRSNVRVERGFAHLLLLHELRIRAIIDDVLAKDGRAERCVDLLRIDVLDLSVQDKVVALGVQAHRHLATEEHEREDVAILRPVSLRRLAVPDVHTFFWFAKKKPYGSMPYVMVLPSTGNQWNTTGGSLGFLSSSCFNTLRTMASRIKEAKPEATSTGKDELEVKSPNGPAMSARTPILCRRGQGAAAALCCLVGEASR